LTAFFVTMLPTDIPYKELSEIEGFEDMKGYYVDIKGNVYSARQKKVKKMKILYAGRNGIRYSRVYLYKNGKRIAVYIHQLVVRAFIPKSNRKRFVVHKSGNLGDNSLDNLITVNKKSFKKDHKAGRPKKEYVERLEKEVFLSDDVLNELKVAYKASLIKGNYKGSEFDFINEIFGELMNEYANRKGLKRIIHQLKSE
jgi:hypothetical protein